MKEQFDFIKTHLRSAWRFRWPALALAWVVCLGGWVGVALMPDVYEASARVYVDTTSELRRLLGEQIIEPDVNAQLAIVRESMLGREQLEQVIRETRLSERVTSPEQLPQFATRLRSEIGLNLASTGARDQLYTITFLDSEREVALEVVQTVLNTFIERALAQGRAATESNRLFLRNQVELLDQRLGELERQLADFRRENADVLTGGEGGFFAQLSGERDALETVVGQLEDAEARRARIEEQLQRLREGESLTSSDADEGEIDPTSTRGRIRTLEQRRDDLLLVYHDTWPEVIQLNEQLDTLNARLENEEAAITGQDPAALSESTVYNDLMTRLNDVEQEIASLETERGRREARVERLQEQMQSVPELEAQESDLLREYEVLSVRYNNMLASLETERLTSDTLESDQVGFEVFDAPSAPSSPVAPPRLVLIVGVLAAGLAGGAAIAYLLAQLRPVFQDPKTLREVTGQPILGVVSLTWKERHKLRRRTEITSFSVGLVALAALCAGVLLLETMGDGLRALVG